MHKPGGNIAVRVIRKAALALAMLWVLAAVFVYMALAFGVAAIHESVRPLLSQRLSARAGIAQPQTS